MKIAIISDIHDNEVNLKKFLFWCENNKIENLICCGDITNGDTLEILANGFLGSIFLVRGNIELYEEAELKKYKNIRGGEKIFLFEIEGKKIGFCHEPFLINKILEDNKPDFIFYGHTHKPWLKEKNGIKIINPGTLGGVFSLPTFGFWDTKSGKLELKILNDL